MEESSECSQVKNLQEEEKAAGLRCPRCDSGNTKFCYYNNYSKLQPRHYCRACRRHWTEGGTLRNVPVGGSRKSKRPRIGRAASGKASDGGDYLTPAREDGDSGGLIIRQATPPLPTPQYEDDHGGDGELSAVQSWTMHDHPFLPEYYDGGASEEPGGNPFSSFSSPSCSSSFYDHAAEDSLFAMESSMTMKLPASNLSHWDDIIDLVNLELKPPPADRVDRSLTY